MKKLLLIFCILFLLIGNVSAQMVLGPTATGFVMRHFSTYTTHITTSPYSSSYIWTPGSIWTSTGSGLYIGRSLFSLISPNQKHSYWTDAVMEFDISGVTPAGVTAANFRSARLDGLKVIGKAGADEMKGMLYDMLDADEDGSLTTGDWHSMRGSGTTLFTTVPTVDTTYNNIDVTDALLHDLFDAEQSNYSGFLLYTDSNGKFVVFDDETPTLTIFIKKVQSAVNFLLLKD